MMLRWLIVVFVFGCSQGATQPTVVIPVTAVTAASHSSASPHAQPRRHSGSSRDRDGDGIADDLDMCPDQPEDYDGFNDDDGCPDPDNDGDGVRDVDDHCPNIAGPAPDGCPRTTSGDRDGDGIPDNRDKCPDDPEDKDGFEDADGCPDPDNDRDGILDVNDKCPNEPETFNGYQDDDGCPDRRP